MKMARKLTALLMAIALFLLLVPAGVKAATGTFTVHYDANGGTGSMIDQTLSLADDTQRFSANGYTRVGYQFAGWNTELTGSGTSISDQAPVSALLGAIAVVDQQTVNFYAQWTKNPSPTNPPASSGTAGRQDSWCITYLDCSGNTVSVQWVTTGGSPEKPAGYNYPDAYGISAHQDIRPLSCDAAGFVVPDTADRN